MTRMNMQRNAVYIYQFSADEAIVTTYYATPHKIGYVTHDKFISFHSLRERVLVVSKMPRRNRRNRERIAKRHRGAPHKRGQDPGKTTVEVVEITCAWMMR